MEFIKKYPTLVYIVAIAIFTFLAIFSMYFLFGILLTYLMIRYLRIRALSKNQLLKIGNYIYVQEPEVVNPKTRQIMDKIIDETKELSGMESDVKANWIIDRYHNDIVGYVVWVEEDGKKWLECIGIAKGYQGMGLTKTVIREIIKYHLNGDSTFYLRVLPENTRAIHVYEKNFGCKFIEKEEDSGDLVYVCTP